MQPHHPVCRPAVVEPRRRFAQQGRLLEPFDGFFFFLPPCRIRMVTSKSSCTMHGGMGDRVCLIGMAMSLTVLQAAPHAGSCHGRVTGIMIKKTCVLTLHVLSVR
jgi:hypothetical protein